MLGIRSSTLAFIPFLLASAAAAQIPVPRPLTRISFGSFTDGVPSLSVEGLRVAVAHKNGLFTGTVQVTTSSDGGVNWSPSLQVDRGPSTSFLRVARSGCQSAGDIVYVTFRDDRNGSRQEDIYFTKSTDFGASWPLTDVRLDDGFAGAGEVDEYSFACDPDTAGNDLYVLMGVDPPGSSDKELFLVASRDAGVTWGSAVKVAGNAAGGVRVEGHGFTVDGSTLHIVWTDDSASPGVDGIYYQRSVDGGLTFLPSPVRLDVTDVLDTGDVQMFGAQEIIPIRLDGDLLAVAWLEERIDENNEELRIAVSRDGGNMWEPDRRVGAYPVGTTDVDEVDLVVTGGTILVGWTDDRSSNGSGGVPDEVFVARSTDLGLTFVETRLSSNGDTGEDIRVTGEGSILVAAFTLDGLFDDAGVVSFSRDAGASWTPPLEVSDISNGDSTFSGEIAYDPIHHNILYIALRQIGLAYNYAGGLSVCDDGSVVMRNGGSNSSSLTAGEALLGGSLTARVDLTTTGHAFAGLVGFAGTTSLSLSGGQTLLVDVLDPAGELLSQPILPGPTADFSFAVPNEPQLCDFFLSIQAVHLGGVIPFALSNAVDLQLAAY